MLPEKMRFDLFDRLSVKTMRYVNPVPRREAKGLVKRVYDMIAEDFFVNGSLSSHSKVPELMAGVWVGGRETILVPDYLDQTTKEAMTATLSSINDCPYCGDMLVSLVHSGGNHQAASRILSATEEHITDSTLRNRLEWVRAVATPGYNGKIPQVFTREELPEAIGSIMAMSHINRFSHVVMDGSPVNVPFGWDRIKQVALRLFGHELKSTKQRTVMPGRSLDLLPPAELPDDLAWARSNPRIADALSRWASTVEKHAQGLIPKQVEDCVQKNLHHWHGEQMPISRSWVEKEVGKLAGKNRAIAKLALVLAKAPYQIDESLVEAVIEDHKDETDFIRVLAWSAFTAARNIASRIARSSEQPAMRVVRAA
jgi:hypothetical protein